MLNFTRAIERLNKPIMVDQETQTVEVTVLSSEQKQKIDNELTKLNSEIQSKNLLLKDNLEDVQRLNRNLQIQVKANEDYLVGEERLKILHQTEIKEFTEKIEHLNNDLINLGKDNTNEINALKKEIEAEKEEQTKKKKNITDLEEQIAKLGRQVDKIEPLSKEIETIKAEKEGLEQNIRDKELEINALVQGKDHVIEELNQAKEKLNNLLNIEKVSVSTQTSQNKPESKDAWTQTELTMADIAEMEKNQANLVNLVKKNYFLDDEGKKRNIEFKLMVIERGIAGLEEDKENSKTQGREMKKKLEELNNEIKLGKISESELKNKVFDLERLVERKETDYRKEIKVKKEEWDKLDNDFREVSELYRRNNQIIKDKELENNSLQQRLNNAEKNSIEAEELQRKIYENTREINNQMMIIDSLHTEIRSLTNSIKDREELLSIARTEKERYEVEIKEIKKTKKELEKALSDLKNSEDDSKKNKDIIHDLNKKLQDKELEILQYQRRTDRESDIFDLLKIYRRSISFGISSKPLQSSEEEVEEYRKGLSKKWNNRIPLETHSDGYAEIMFGDFLRQHEEVLECIVFLDMERKNTKKHRLTIPSFSGSDRKISTNLIFLNLENQSCEINFGRRSLEFECFRFRRGEEKVFVYTDEFLNKNAMSAEGMLLPHKNKKEYY